MLFAEKHENAAFEKKNGSDISDYNLCDGFCRIWNTKLIFSDLNTAVISSI